MGSEGIQAFYFAFQSANVRIPSAKRFYLANWSHQQFGGASSAGCYRQKNVIAEEHPQNADLPSDMPKLRKKPFPVPLKELRRIARLRQRTKSLRPRKPIAPPRNGLLVSELIPVAHKVFEARMLLLNGVAELLKVIPVHACRACDEVHIGPVGHPFKTCSGGAKNSGHRLHDWSDCYVEDIIVPIDAYHLFDRLKRPPTHDERFAFERVPAIVELCIQAGLDLPPYLTRRRIEPIFYFGKEMFDPNEDEAVYDMKAKISNQVINLYEPYKQNEFGHPLSSSGAIRHLAEQTLEAWTTLRRGALKLMKKYRVYVCGYCAEVHVGPFGHGSCNCRGYKTKQRHGRHAWQVATIDDIIPPKHVWHIPDPKAPLLKQQLKHFYGQAPAVVELCVQAGAAIPQEFKPTMRLRVSIPESVAEANIAA